MLEKAGVPTEVDPQKPNALLGTLVTVILPVLLIGGILLFVMNRSQGGGGRVMQFGRSRHKTVNKDQPKTTFGDVAGVDEAIEELQEVKDYLQSPSKFQAMGAKIPRGVLLFGPPGTGKTLLARAVAGEAGVPFFSISGSDFVEMFVGVGAARVRDLFEQAKTTAPAIVFIDEIDAVGRQRGAGLGGGHDEREQTLNQLLVEMDGFDQRSTVILMAATNRPDILDPALLRPGRFDRQVVVDRPDLEGRKAILRVHARGKPFDSTVDLAVLARRTPGFTGADLANAINEAALLAARRNKTAISMKEVEEAVDRVMAGPERKSRIMDEGERRLIAYHEGCWRRTSDSHACRARSARLVGEHCAARGLGRLVWLVPVDLVLGSPLGKQVRWLAAHVAPDELAETHGRHDCVDQARCHVVDAPDGEIGIALGVAHQPGEPHPAHAHGLAAILVRQPVAAVMVERGRFAFDGELQIFGHGLSIHVGDPAAHPPHRLDPVLRLASVPWCMT